MSMRLPGEWPRIAGVKRQPALSARPLIKLAFFSLRPGCSAGESPETEPGPSSMIQSVAGGGLGLAPEIGAGFWLGARRTMATAMLTEQERQVAIDNLI